MTETITLKLESEAARFYKDAPASDQEKLQALIGSWLTIYADENVDSLKKIMVKMSRDAKAQGLTPDILDSLLADG